MDIKKAKLVKVMKFCQLYGGTLYRCKRSLQKHRVPARMIKKCWVEATGIINKGFV
ncbi:hypothetical protein [Proteus phage vB_PmiP_RS8pmA]|uniref:Uncharacterized protein n=1 Tax=Proteus phage vB_PmiP_RS8pmA TaxID=2250314 RepID=A0A514CY60_9CAUD|nr:hypothetical protein [Proteus phage vB_PmiP_RS8pmA]